MNKYHYSKGLSLIEILVIIAIIGIFATLGTQGYRSIITGADTMKAGTELVQHLNDIRFRAFSENKHYKVRIVNRSNNARFSKTITYLRKLIPRKLIPAKINT